MAESLYRRNPEGNIVTVLRGRKAIMNRPQTGGESPSVRNPCYAFVTGHDKSCGGGGSMQLPHDESTWDLTYKPSIKPEPDLESVTIEYGGDWGLARKLSATIRCYKISDFEQVQRYFLLPGNEIDVRFGYKKTWGVQQGEKSLKKFKVASFSFNTNQEGQWIASFTAVSSATAIKNLDMQISIKNTSGNIKYLTGTESTPHKVVGVAQLIAADAQKNGQYSIDSQKDGDVIDQLTDYSPNVKYDPSAAIVVYTGDHLRNLGEKATAWIGGLFNGTMFGNDEVESANNQVYLTLGYVVNRIINDQLLRAMSNCIGTHDKGDFNKLKVEFHPIYSKSKISDIITSGDPTTVLLLGDANYKNQDGDGKDFDGDCQQLGKVTSKSSNGDIKLQNILIHRSVVTAAYQAATKQRESESDSTNPKDTKEEVVNIVDFFEKVSDHISQAVGGSICLRLVDDPTDLDKLIVVDQNYGVTDKLNCIVFNPIDGDGSTRSCEVASNVGSEEYKAAMFVGSSKGGDAVSAIRGCSNELKNVRQTEFQAAAKDIYELVIDPGNLGKNYFNGQEINALKSAMGRAHRSNTKTPENETVHYPGLSISLEIDGVWGFIPGNAISSTQIPKKWRDTYKSYFMVTRTTHNLAQSDWSTKVDGILAYYPNINFINL